MTPTSRVSSRLPQLGQHVVARDAGQHEVEDDDVGPLLPRGLERVGPVGRGRDPEARLGEMVGDERGDVRLVVDHENAVRHDGLSASPASWWLLHPARERLRSRAVALAAHAGVVVHHGVEDGRQQAALRAEVAAEAVEHELGDRRVAHQLGPPEHLKVAGDGGLGEVEHGLEVGDEQRRRRQAVEDAEPGRLGDGEQQLGGRQISADHMRSGRIYRKVNMRKGPRLCRISAPPRLYFARRCSPSSPRSARRRSAPGHRPRRARCHHRPPRPRHRVGLRRGPSVRWRRRAGGDRGGLAPRALSRARSWWWMPATCCRAIRSPPISPGWCRASRTRSIEAMNLAGYDVATPGNHDFDWGVAVLPAGGRRGALSLRERQHLALPGDTLLFPPIAWSSARACGWASPASPRPARWSGTGTSSAGGCADGADPPRPRRRCSRRAARRRRDRGPGAQGLDGRASYERRASAARTWRPALADLPARPDIVVVGHSHREMRDSVISGVHFVQPSPSARASRWSTSTSRGTRGAWRVRRIRAELVSTARGRRRRRCWRSGSRPARRPVRDWARTPIGLATGADARRRRRGSGPPRSSISSRTSSAGGPGAELSAASAFDLRAGFDADTIRVGHVLALYPYENTLRAMRLSGAQLKAYLEWSARYFRVDAGGPRRAQRLGAGLQLRHGRRGAATISTSAGRRRPDPAPQRPRSRRSSRPTASRWRSTAIGRRGAGGYDMVRGAPVVYDKGERILELLIDAVRARSPLDSGRARGDAELADRARDGRPARCAGSSASPRAAPKAARDTVLLRVLATGDLHGRLLPGAGALGAALDSLGERVRLPVASARRGRRDAGHPGPGRDAGARGMEVLGRLGYAAAALGDHDFDWWLDVLRAADGRVALSLAGGQRRGQRHGPAARLDRAISRCSTWRACRWR